MSETALIAYGQADSVNFTSDGFTPTADHTDVNFPATNVAQYDLGEPWRTSWGAPVTAGGFDYYDINFDWDFDSAIIQVDIFAILEHNLEAIEEFAEDNGGALTFKLVGSQHADYSLPEIEVWLTDLAGQDVIAHRPEDMSQYWRLFIRLVVTTATDVDDYQISIGRMFLNSNFLTFQPTQNYDRGWSITKHDPSSVSNTMGGAQRVVEQAQFRSLVLPFTKLIEADWQTLEKIYKRQGKINPVFVSPNPASILIGNDEPGPNDYDRDALYGYFPAEQTIHKIQAGIQVGSVTLNVIEAGG